MNLSDLLWTTLTLGVPLAGVNPKNLIVTLGAAAGLPHLGLGGAEAAVALIWSSWSAASASPSRRPLPRR